MKNIIISVIEKITALAVGIALLFLALYLHIRVVIVQAHTSPSIIVTIVHILLLNVISPMIVGMMVGWLTRKYGTFFATLVLLPFVYLLILSFLLKGISGPGYYSKGDLSDPLGEFGIMFFWMAILPLGGFLGEKLYWKFHPQNS